MKKVGLLLLVFSLSSCGDSDPWGKLDFLLLTPFLVVGFFIWNWITNKMQTKDRRTDNRDETPHLRKKSEPTNYLNDFLKQHLFNLITVYTQLAIKKNLLPQDTDNLKAFIIAFDNKVNALRETNVEPDGWYTLPSEFFKSLNGEEKRRAIEILLPFEKIAMTYLEKITSEPDTLIIDITRHKVMAQKYLEFSKAGGHINQNREFISNWIKTISPQWFSIAHFIVDIEAG